MNAAQTQARLTYTLTLIEKYEEAIDAVIVRGVASYELNTGQSTQKVSKLDEQKLNSALDKLYNRCATLQARLTGAGSHIGRMV